MGKLSDELAQAKSHIFAGVPHVVFGMGQWYRILDRITALELTAETGRKLKRRVRLHMRELDEITRQDNIKRKVRGKTKGEGHATGT